MRASKGIVSAVGQQVLGVGEGQNPTRIEEYDEDQADKCVRGQSGKGSALLYGHFGLYQEGRFRQRVVSLADRDLSGRAERNRVATRPERQPSGQGIPASYVRAAPTRG